jgi:hypothetical protein
MATLHVRPDLPVVPWDQFISTYEPGSIALDGFVGDGPRMARTKRGVFINLNHHEGCDRLATRSTAAQALMLLRMGLFQSIPVEKMHVWVSDCDQDVCLASWILMNGWLVENPVNPHINKLTHLGDVFDATGGMYPYPMGPHMGHIAWVYEPYDRFRALGGLAQKDADAFRGVIEDVHARIRAYVCGMPGSVTIDTRYEILDKVGGVSVVHEQGPHARGAMISDGVSAYVSVRGPRTGTPGCPVHDVTLGIQSLFIPYDLPGAYGSLQTAEVDARKAMGHPAMGVGDAWGGADTIGGSPRVSGTVLTPQTIAGIMESHRMD